MTATATLLLQFSSMASSFSILSSSNNVTNSFSCNSRIRSAISIPKLPKKDKLLKDLNMSNVNTFFKKNTNNTFLPSLDNITTTATTTTTTTPQENTSATTLATTKLHVVLEAILDRIEMHKNICEQRVNWNSLLLNSLNMITLTAATMAACMSGLSDERVLGLKAASTLLFTSGAGILLIMNKIQPSQLVEEQRNAVRLLKQLRNTIQTTLSIGSPTQQDVDEAMEKVLALDRAYPLPLLGAMLDKFPSTFEPANWWTSNKEKSMKKGCYYKQNLGAKKEELVNNNNNGWTKELEEEMKQIVKVIEKRDIEDYFRLGNKALKLNKTLATLGPMLMGTAAVGSALVGHGGPWGGLVAAVAGSMAAAVNTIEHGGQVGMVFEMYRNCAGFFRLLEEKVESNLEEENVEKRENGEVFEMKMALHLGRSLSELRDFATANASVEISPKGEFASKLF